MGRLEHGSNSHVRVSNETAGHASPFPTANVFTTIILLSIPGPQVVLQVDHPVQYQSQSTSGGPVGAFVGHGSGAHISCSKVSVGHSSPPFDGWEITTTFRVRVAPPHVAEQALQIVHSHTQSTTHGTVLHVSVSINGSGHHKPFPTA